MEVVIRQATISDIDALVPLFDGYRQFYRQSSEPDRIKRFLLDRFENNQSVIFIAVKEWTAIGFTQLYPSFSSGALARIYILNDLFVHPSARQNGTGSALLQAVAEYGRRVGALRLVLSTEVTNMAAQSLYEKLGWQRNTEFCTYQITLSAIESMQSSRVTSLLSELPDRSQVTRNAVVEKMPRRSSHKSNRKSIPPQQNA